MGEAEYVVQDEDGAFHGGEGFHEDQDCRGERLFAFERPGHRILLGDQGFGKPWAQVGFAASADFRSAGQRLIGGEATLPAGTDGPPPHFHRTSAELFFLLDGTLQVLAGDEVVVMGAGDFLLVPAGMVHAWAAPASAAADVLIVFTPGIERFEYFRLGERIMRGEASPARILDTQDRFDNHFVESPLWQQHRTTARQHDPAPGEMPRPRR